MTQENCSAAAVTAMTESHMTIEGCLLSWYIKYDRLTQLMQAVTADTNRIHFYVDLNSLLNRVYKIDNSYDTPNSLVVGLLNLVAHYRHFFRNRYNVATRFYLTYADEANGSHTQYLPTFGKSDPILPFIYEARHYSIETQLNLIATLVNYIPEVYYIRSHASFAEWTCHRIVKDTTDKGQSSATHIILTTSKYVYQVPALFYGSQVYVMKPMKSKEGDESVIVRPDTVLLAYYNKLTPNSSVRTILPQLNPKLLSLLMTFNGCRDKKITAVTNINRAAIMVYKAIVANQIMNDYSADMGFVYTALESFNVHTIIDLANFENRFRGLDVRFQTKLFKVTPEAKNESWHKDLHDPETMKQLNELYFKDTPIDLLRL